MADQKYGAEQAFTAARKSVHDEIDRIFDAAMDTFGIPPGTGVFDRRVLCPIDMMLHAVECESGEAMDPSRINSLAERGWFSFYVSDYTGETVTGVPQYVLSRIALFLKLEKRGYKDAELRPFAEYEDAMVADIYTADELAYRDDDLEILLTTYRSQAQSLENSLRVIDDPAWQPDSGSWSVGRDRAEYEKELKLLRPSIARFEAYQDFGIPSAEERRVALAAFRIRWLDEFVRISMIESERQQLEAGYSFFIVFDPRATRNWPIPEEFAPPGAIDWSETLRRPWVAEAEPQIIRFPGLVIEDGEVRLLGSPSPSRYQELWREYDLEGFYRARAELRDETVCFHCFGELPKPANPRKKFCSESCRNAAKQKRFRERRPLRDLEHKRRYYSSLKEIKEHRNDLAPPQT